MLVIPLLALNNAGPRTPGGVVRVAAGAPGIAAASPAPPGQVMDAVLAIAGGDTSTAVVTQPAPVASSVPRRAATSKTTLAAPPVSTGVHIASARTYSTSSSTSPPPPRQTEDGPASWYGAPAGTCAHQTLPFGTVLSIRDVDNGRTATCTVEDRGPYLDGRIVDLAPDVFAQMAPTAAGVINVEISWRS
jgi:rare lipoprotein A